MKTSLFRISCLSQVDCLHVLLTHSRSVTVRLPAEAQRPSTSTGLTRTAFFIESKVDGHWITLRLGPSHWRSASLGVDGGVGGPGRWTSARWLEGLQKTELTFDWQRFCTIKRRQSAFQSSSQSHRGFCKWVKRQTATYLLIFAWRNC